MEEIRAAAPGEVIGKNAAAAVCHSDIHLVKGTFYKAGKLKLDELITKRYKLEEINEAMKAVERCEALRSIIVF